MCSLGILNVSIDDIGFKIVTRDASLTKIDRTKSHVELPEGKYPKLLFLLCTVLHLIPSLHLTHLDPLEVEGGSIKCLP